MRNGLTKEAWAAVRRYERIGRPWRALGLTLQWVAVAMIPALAYFGFYEPLLTDWPWSARMLYLAAILGGLVVGYLFIQRGEARRAAYYAAVDARSQSEKGAARR